MVCRGGRSRRPPTTAHGRTTAHFSIDNTVNYYALYREMLRYEPCAVVEHAFAHQRLPSPVLFLPPPADCSQYCSDTPLVGGADARRLDANRSARHFANGHLRVLVQVAGAASSLQRC